MSTKPHSQRRVPHTRGDAKLVAYDEYIDTQVESTRRLVKVVDLATSLAMLAAGVLAFLLVAAAVEHWLVPGGFPFVARLALFGLLVGGVAYIAYRRLWPLAVHTINPVYAAQIIEHSGPTLKNSLVNLLLFRQRRSEISDAVYQTLEEQAAQRLSRVPVDTAVDRSLLIRVGYVLLAVVAVASLYKVFSPKDPFVAAQRVLMPWANIVPSSRVSILNIEPGSVTVSRGEFIDVSADVRNVDENDPVLVRFTTEDGQAVNKPVPMKLAKDGLRFVSRLPERDDAAGDVGLAQNLRYHIEAGDARSLEYDVTVVASPSILVERVAYEYPAYTGYVNRYVEGLGDIRAIEGTRVTIHARANGAIDKARVDFDADGRPDLPMTTNGTAARASFNLRLREDRLTPRHASYVLRLVNSDGRTNRDPVKYAIDVEPDIGPEASILLPKERELLLRLDETVAIEVEARDPDFALSEVRLRGEVAGREVLNEPLLEGKHRGRFTQRYQLTPSANDLRVGDVLEYWVTANDNRAPESNTVASERKVLRIVSPDPAQQPPPDQLAQNDPRRGQRDQQPREERQQNGQQHEGAGGQENQGGERQPGAAGRGEDQPDDRELSGDTDRREEPRQGDTNEPKRQEEGEDTRDGGAVGEQQGAPSDPQGHQSEQRDRQARPGQQGSSDNQTGAGAAGGEAPQEGAQPAGARPQDSRGERPIDGQRQNGDGQLDPNTEQAPVSSEGDNDAEAFERIRRHLEREGELPEGDAQRANEPISRDAERNAEERRGQERARQRGGEKGNEDASARERDVPSGEPAERTEEQGEGSGAEVRGGEPEDATAPLDERRGSEKSPGGEETSSKGPSGAGDEQQPQGAPDSQPGMKPGEKRQPSPSPGEETDATEPPAGARGKKESDSQGDQGGDRAGGGEEGGGQKAPREGTGSAGQNQSADEGAGQSTEQGTGSDSPNAGQDSRAEKRTGEPGGEAPGRGSRERDGEGQGPGSGDARRRPDEEARLGDQGGSEQERQDEKRFGREDAADRSSEDANRSGRQPGAATGGGGEMGTEAGPPPRVGGTVPEGDEANLEYAREQTDMVLGELADQLDRKQVDENLLDDLGWSEDDLRRFVERWQARKEAAQRKDALGDAARRELEEALRSLGLGRGPLQQERLKKDTMRDLREGYRGAVPLEYRERLKAYSQGVSRARQQDEER